MNIYFHIDELNRDAVVASALKKKFAQKGHQLIYGNRVSNRLLKYFHSAFDIIIIPRPHFLYDSWGENWMSWKTRFIMLSTESLGIICKDHHVMAKTLLEKDYFEGKRKYIDRIDAFCFWGMKQLQAVKEYAPEVLKKCNVVGHPRHDQLCVGGLNIKNKNNLPRSKKIGIILRAGGLNDYFNRSPLDAYTILFDPHFQYEYRNEKTGEYLVSKGPKTKPGDALAVYAIDVQNILKIINSLIKSGYQVSVRAHPKENRNIWRDLLVRCSFNPEIPENKLPFTKWLQGLDYIIGLPSTSFYDAAMLGVIPVSTCSLDPRRSQFIGELWEDNNRLMEHIYKPKTIDALLNYIKEENHNVMSPEVKSILKEEADFPECRESLDKVVEVCDRCANNKKAKKIFLYLFYIVRPVYFWAWKLRQKLSGRKQNSASFTLSRKTSCFIDSLTS
jgi:surface carbohydrate biosynthesis protein